MTNDLRPNQEEMSMTTEASLEFLPREVPSDDGPMTVEAADVIPGVLALRRLTCLDGEVLYLLMHSPTGYLFCPMGCSDLAEAIDATNELWMLFTPDHRKRLESTVPGSFADAQGLRHFFARIWYPRADVQVNFLKPPAKENQQ